MEQDTGLSRYVCHGKGGGRAGTLGGSAKGKSKSGCSSVVREGEEKAYSSPQDRFIKEKLRRTGNGGVFSQKKKEKREINDMGEGIKATGYH